MPGNGGLMMVFDIKEALLLHIQPGDAIVLKMPRAVTAQDAEMIKDAWHRAITGPLAQAELIILDGGADIAVLRHGSEDADLTKIARDAFKKQTVG